MSVTIRINKNFHAFATLTLNTDRIHKAQGGKALLYIMLWIKCKSKIPIFISKLNYCDTKHKIRDLR